MRLAHSSSTIMQNRLVRDSDSASSISATALSFISPSCSYSISEFLVKDQNHAPRAVADVALRQRGRVPRAGYGAGVGAPQVCTPAFGSILVRSVVRRRRG